MAFLRAVCSRTAVAACVAASLLVSVAAEAQGPPHETEVRAAFLYNFTKFVDWPASAQKSAEPFRMCVLADAEFTRAVETIIGGESVLGRPLVLITPETPEVARACQLLFVAHAEPEGARYLAAVRDYPVLTVGDAPRFLDAGGAIQFVLVDQRVRFDINLVAAERAGLRVSSNLLRVARTITPNRTHE
jgi:YfiR/HmsC-like